MKAFLMYRDRDFDQKPALPPNEPDLRQDLELDTLFDAMAAGDAFLRKSAEAAIFAGIANDADTIRYRQDVLRDCLHNQDAVHALYDIAIEPLELRKSIFFGFTTSHPDMMLSGAVRLLQGLRSILGKLVHFARVQAPDFRSEGFRRFLAMITGELDDEYFATIDTHLAALRFRHGILVSAQLGRGNRGTHYVLRKFQPERWAWLKDLLHQGPPSYSFSIDPRDQAGNTALSELRDRGLADAANTVAQSADHILAFLDMLRTELAFYLGCLTLHDQLASKGVTLCNPTPLPAPDLPAQELPAQERGLSFAALRDPCLSLAMDGPVIANDFDGGDTALVVITGANQGGKSTFLRSVGLAQMMMQAGMFVAAERYTADLCDGVCTHYRREEDAGLNSGKFDEELRRMSRIADQMTKRPLMLFNESFAATNEREGSEIARQIITALIEAGAKIVFVTHMYALASRLMAQNGTAARFLRAERTEDGKRSFKLIEGPPLETSYGKDLYEQIFMAPAPSDRAPSARNRSDQPAERKPS